LPNQTTLASGTINGADQLSVELVQPVDAPASVLIRWPAAPTVCDPRRYNEIASTAMRLLAAASTTLAQIRASRRL
jgi:hypothetical protein